MLTIITNTEALKMKLELSTIETKSNTIGVMRYNGFECFTLELPWLENAQNISCIPAGTYQCKKHFSHKFGDCVSVNNVAARTHVLIHSGNYTRHTQGCILVGESVKDMNSDGEIDVSNSRITLVKLLAELPREFQLVINRITK